MIMPTLDQHMLEDSSDAHSAVDAWLALDMAHRRPDKVTPLYASDVARKKHRKRRKSAVYKLEGAGPDGSAIVAKNCSSATANLERTIYKRILPQLPINSLQYHGDIETHNSHWLFLEYARGVEWKVDNSTHLELATKWLAEMHGSSAQLDTLSLLPCRGTRYYLSQLTTARHRIQQSVSNPALDPADNEILDKILTYTDLLESHWQDIETFCEWMPETLVHNDFVSKNVHVRDTKTGPEIFVFDWEMSGKGATTVDLNWMFQKAPEAIITRYWEHLKEFNINIALQDIKHLVLLGAIFRIMDTIEWASQYLSTHSPSRGVYLTKHYTDRLKYTIHALGWS